MTPTRLAAGALLALLLLSQSPSQSSETSKPPRAPSPAPAATAPSVSVTSPPVSVQIDTAPRVAPAPGPDPAEAQDTLVFITERVIIRRGGLFGRRPIYGTRTKMVTQAEADRVKAAQTCSERRLEWMRANDRSARNTRQKAVCFT